MKPFCRSIVTIGIFLTVMLTNVGTANPLLDFNKTADTGPIYSTYPSTIDVDNGGTGTTFVSEVDEPVAEDTEIQPYHDIDPILNTSDVD